MTYRGMTLPCCSCDGVLVDVTVLDKQVARCPGCNGFWIELGSMGGMLARGYRGKDVPDLLEFEDGSPRHPCAVCREEMHSVWLEHLRFERCAAHGYWLPGRDLARLGMAS